MCRSQSHVSWATSFCSQERMLAFERGDSKIRRSLEDYQETYLYIYRLLVDMLFTLGKFTSKAAIIAIVEAQTNAAELDSPDPI